MWVLFEYSGTNDMHMGDRWIGPLGLGFIYVPTVRFAFQQQLYAVTAVFLRQQCGPDPSKGAPAKHGGTRGCLLFSVQQKGQPAKWPGGPTQEPEG